MHKQGFTFLEILIAVGIIGLLLILVAPNFMGTRSLQERKEAISNLNALTQLSWQNALIENKIHKVKFDLEHNVISIEIATGEYEKYEPKFKLLTRTYIATQFAWPDQLEIKQFLIEKRDTMKELGGRKGNLWFFVMPDGLAQEVIINLIDTKDIRPDGKVRPIGLVLNPFNAQFKEYDTFQK